MKMTSRSSLAVSAVFAKLPIGVPLFVVFCWGAAGSALVVTGPSASAGNKPPEYAALVIKNKAGGLSAAGKDGKPIDGIKLSVHDKNVYSPKIAVGADGSIHVAYAEFHAGTSIAAIYHRSSSDGGQTWTEAKNLSEILPGWIVGRCEMVIDKQNRVYVVWPFGSKPGLNPRLTFYQDDVQETNLVYRVLSGGKWSKLIHAHPQVNPETYKGGSLRWFAAIDAAGKAHLIWNSSRNLVFQATLDGADPVKPRLQQTSVKIGDGIGLMSGYVDAAGKPHILAQIQPTPRKRISAIFELLEDNKRTPVFESVDEGAETVLSLPALLLDSQGRRHVIAIFPAGERPHVRDWLIGSDEEPTAVVSAPPGGIVHRMQACQGAGGRMIVFSWLLKTGPTGLGYWTTWGDTYVSVSDGGAWSAAVDLTNNAGREIFMVKGFPYRTQLNLGPTAGTFDKDGNLLVVFVRGELTQHVGGRLASTTPTLRFLKLENKKKDG